MPTSDNLQDFYKENRRLIIEYLETRMEIIRLKTIGTLSRVLGMLILVTLISFMVLFFILFLVIAFSWYIAGITGSAALGFLSGGSIFLLIMLICIIFRKPLFLNPLIRLFIHISTQEQEEEF